MGQSDHYETVTECHTHAHGHITPTHIEITKVLNKLLIAQNIASLISISWKLFMTLRAWHKMQPLDCQKQIMYTTYFVVFVALFFLGNLESKQIIISLTDSYH